MTYDYDILIPGGYFCDIVFTGLPDLPTLGTEIFASQINVVPGGGAINTSIGLHRLRVKVGWLGTFGNDFFSRAIADQLSAEQLDLSQVIRLDGPLQRVTVSLSYPADRAFVTYVDSLSDNVDRAFDALDRLTFRHLHFGGLVTDPRTPALLDACHARGITVSMDCQHRPHMLAEVESILSRLDMFMPNAAEAIKLTASSSIDQAIDRLAVIVPLVVIKQGADGARARQGGQDFHVPSIPANVVDTTGAGDAFNAGFLAATLAGHDPAEALRWGNFCGSRSVQGVGGARTAPTIDELYQWLETLSNR